MKCFNCGWEFPITPKRAGKYLCKECGKPLIVVGVSTEQGEILGCVEQETLDNLIRRPE